MISRKPFGMVICHGGNGNAPGVRVGGKQAFSHHLRAFCRTLLHYQTRLEIFSPRFSERGISAQSHRSASVPNPGHRVGMLQVPLTAKSAHNSPSRLEDVGFLVGAPHQGVQHTIWHPPETPLRLRAEPEGFELIIPLRPNAPSFLQSISIFPTRSRISKPCLK